MIYKKAILVAASVILGCSFNIAADAAANTKPEAGNVEGSQAVPNIIVEEERLQSWRERLESLMVFTGLTRNEFANRPGKDRLGDVIDRMPGVFMGGPPGENKDIRLRGMDKEFTRFEFDSLQLPGAGEKREFQVNRLSPFAVAQVKILRNTTAEFESDGIAGRVVAELRAIPQQLQFDFKSDIGGIDSIDGTQREISFGVGNRISRQFGFNLFVDYNRFPGEKEQRKSKFKADGTLKQQETENENKPNDSFNVMADAAFFYDGGEFHFKPLWFRLDEEKDKRKLKLTPGKDPEQELEDEDKAQTTWGGTLSNVHRWSSGFELESDASYVTTEEGKGKNKQKFKDKGNGFVLDKTETEDEDKEDEFWQFRSKLTKPFEWGVSQTLKSGFHLRFRDRFRDKDKIEVKPNGKTKDITRPKDNYQMEERYWAIFIQDELQFTPAFSWDVGLRAEQVQLTSASGDGIQRKESFADLNPSTHLHLRLSENWSLQGAVSRSVNRPKFDEIALFEEEKKDRFVQGNPDVKPATAENFDVGLTYATEQVIFAINLFHKDIDGLIEEVDTGIDKGGKDVFRVENVGDGWIQGIEFEQRLEFGESYAALRGLSLWANESLFKSKLRDQDGTTRRFSDQPDLIANFGFEYSHLETGLSLNLAAKFRDEIEKKKAAGETEIEDARWNLDLGVRKRIGDEAFLFFDALNLTNAGKDKTRTSPNGDREFEKETTGPVFLVGIKASF